MKINIEKIKNLSSENKKILEILGIVTNEFPFVGEIYIETFENQDSTILNPVYEKSHFKFEYSWDSKTGKIHQFCIYLGSRLMFVYHSGEWTNKYSSEKCNWGTGHGISSDGEKYASLEKCIQNRTYNIPGAAIDSIAMKNCTYANLNENSSEIKRVLLK